MEENTVIIVIFAMAAVTYLPRLIPLWALSGKKLPEPVVSWLRQVPPAVLAALLLPSVLMPGGRLALGSDNLFLWAAIPTLIAAVISKSLFLPVIIGMLVVILARLLGG
jgi:branched-subunit amino acid transport protein